MIIAIIDLYERLEMNTKELINKLINKIKVHKSKYTIIFLANVRELTPNNSDYEDSSILTEFLSINEYNELITSLQEYGFYVLIYFDTNEFISDYLLGKFSNTSVIIFEGSQKGIGKARDAFVPTFCDLQNIRHTGPNAYVNSICSNKYHWSKLLEYHNITVPKSWRYSSVGWLNNQNPPQNKLLISKPCYECASIGVHRESVSHLNDSYESYLRKMSKSYNQPMIVQEFIPGYEVEVPLLIHDKNPYILPPVVLYQNNNVMMGENFLDFENIYDDNYHFCLLETINIEYSQRIQGEVMKIISILELEKYARIDFRISSNGKCYVIDINSYPHIVSHSSFAYAFTSLGFHERDVLPCIIANIL